MEEIKIKHKIWQIVEKISDTTFKVKRKKKSGVLKQFMSESDEFSSFLENYKRLKIANVRMPKVYEIDKKRQSIIIEDVQGELVIDTLLKKDLDDTYFKEIFEQDWLARYEKITLNFYPDKWLFTNGKLYYLAFNYYDGLNDNKSFEKYYIRYWFFTKDFIKYAKSLNKQVDESRLKDEYQINKQMVLTTINNHII